MAKLYLAVGHGRSTDGTWDSGCTYGSDTEAEMAYKIAGVCLRYLRASGLTVYSDYDSGNDKNIVKCVAEANSLGVDNYISFHLDYDKAPSGTLPLYVSSAGKSFAEVVDSAYRRTTGLPLRSIKYQEDYEVTGTNMTACIFELGGIKADNKILHDAELCGKGMAQGLCDYFGIKMVGSSGTTTAKTVSTTTKAVATTNKYNFSSIFAYGGYLERGDEGDVVRQLQRDLNLCGYGPLTEDGDYGPATEQAVYELQEYNGLEEDGLYGNDSDIALMNEIAEIQTLLNKKGYKIDVDGVTGGQTLTAVKEFQFANGLTADGMVGKQTMAALKK